MSESASPHETILRLCAQSAPSPWYPSDLAAAMGIDRARFDPVLNDLRLAGLIEMTEWVSGRGQGYLISQAGEQVLRSPSLMSALRSGQIPTFVPAKQPASSGIDERTPYGRGEAIRNALLHPIKPRVTHALLAINILVFISGAVLAGMNGRHMAFLSRGDAQALHLTGSVSGADLVNGHWWRLLTCCFVHFGFMHLFMNMYSLFVVGPFVEQLWGRYRYLAIYLLAGVGGSSVAMWHRPISNLAGASGALWGILGALAVWWVANRRFLPPQLFKAQMRQLLTVLIMNGIISFLPGISWTAHFGGAAVGAVVALLLHLHRFGTTPLRWVFLALTPLIPVICIGGLVRDRSRNAAWREIKQFDEVDVFQKLYLPRVEGIRVQFDQFLSGDFDDLQKLAQRRPGTVKAAKENILSMRGAANQLTEELEKTRFDSNLVSSASKAALHYLGQVIRLIDMIDDKLESNQEFDEAIDRQIDRTQGARNEWIKKLRDG